jgi:cytoskeletal protein RodZ
MIIGKTSWMQNVDTVDVQRIGNILRKKREERRLPLEAIHTKIYVSLGYLAAMEAGDISKFPAEVYYLSTLRQYARFLGIDAQELMHIYHTKNVQVQNEQPMKDDSRKSKALKIYLAVVLMAGAVVFALLLKESRPIHRSLPGAVQTPPLPAVSTPTVSLPSVSARTKMFAAIPVPGISTRTIHVPVISTRTASTALPAKKLMLDVKIKDTAWLKVTADNTILFEGTLVAGSEKQWIAQSNFYVVVGYAPGVIMNLNGNPIDVLKGAQQDINQLSLTWDDVRRR